MTLAIATITAVSVPGRIGIHLSASVAAVSWYRGSIAITLAPFSLAFIKWYMVFVPEIIRAGSQPHKIIILELSRSSRLLPTITEPYWVREAQTAPSEERFP